MKNEIQMVAIFCDYYYYILVACYIMPMNWMSYWFICYTKRDQDFAFLFFSSSLHSTFSAESSTVIFCFWEISKTVKVRETLLWLFQTLRDVLRLLFGRISKGWREWKRERHLRVFAIISRLFQVVWPGKCVPTILELVWRSGEKLYKFVVKNSRRPYSGKKKQTISHRRKN